MRILTSYSGCTSTSVISKTKVYGGCMYGSGKGSGKRLCEEGSENVYKDIISSAIRYIKCLV